MSPERKKAIEEHFEKEIELFKKEALEIALERDYPFIKALLSDTIVELGQRAAKQEVDSRIGETKFYYIK